MADEDFAFYAFKLHSGITKYIPCSIKENRNFLYRCLKASPFALYGIGSIFADNFDTVTAAVSQHPMILQCAGEKCKNNRDIVLLCVVKDGLTLKYASQKCKRDSDIVTATVTQNGNALELSGAKYISCAENEQIVNIAIQNDISAFKYEAPCLLSNPDFVAKIIYHNVSCFQYVDSKLRKDHNFILSIAKSNPDILRYVHTDMYKDETFMLAVLKMYPDIIRFAHPTYGSFFDSKYIVFSCDTLNKDINVALSALAIAPNLHGYFYEIIRSDPRIIAHQLENERWILS